MISVRVNVNATKALNGKEHGLQVARGEIVPSQLRAAGTAGTLTCITFLVLELWFAMIRPY